MESSRSQTLHGIGLICLAVALLAVMDTLVKHLVRSEPLGLVVFSRYAFSLLGLLAMLPFARVAVWRTARLRLQVLRAALLLLASGFMFLSVRMLPLAETYAISFLAPLLVALLAPVTLGERVGLVRWIAVAAGFLGVLVVVRPGSGVLGWPALLPAGMALAYALYQLVTRRIAAFDGAMVTMFWSALLGSIGAAAFLPWSGRWPEPWIWAQLVVVGLVGLAGQLALIRAFALAPASTISPYVYTQIVWAVPLGWLVFGDVPDVPTLSGAAIVIASGLWLLHRETQLRS